MIGFSEHAFVVVGGDANFVILTSNDQIPLEFAFNPKRSLYSKFLLAPLIFLISRKDKNLFFFLLFHSPRSPFSAFLLVSFSSSGKQHFDEALDHIFISLASHEMKIHHVDLYDGSGPR
jgi:hypothetical protein